MANKFSKCTGCVVLKNYEMQSNNVPGNSRTRKTASSESFPLFALLPPNWSVMWSILMKHLPLINIRYEASSSSSYQGQQNPKNGNAWENHDFAK